MFLSTHLCSRDKVFSETTRLARPGREHPIMLSELVAQEHPECPGIRCGVCDCLVSRGRFIRTGSLYSIYMFKFDKPFIQCNIGDTHTSPSIYSGHHMDYAAGPLNPRRLLGVRMLVKSSNMGNASSSSELPKRRFPLTNSGTQRGARLSSPLTDVLPSPNGSNDKERAEFSEESR